MKRVRLKESSSSGFDKQFIYDLTVDVYKDLLTQEGEKAVENTLAWNAAHYGGMKRAKEIVANNAQIYYRDVRSVAKAVEKTINKEGLGKRKPKKAGERKDTGFNPEYIYELAVKIHTDRMKAYPNGYTAKLLESYREKYKSEERALKRFNDRSQGSASVVKATLRALEARNLLPAKAFN